MSQSGRYIGNPLYDGLTDASTGTATTSMASANSGGYNSYSNQQQQQHQTPADISASSRRQAFGYGSNTGSYYGTSNLTRSSLLRPHSHDLYDDGGYHDRGHQQTSGTGQGRYNTTDSSGSAGSASRYLELPNAGGLHGGLSFDVATSSSSRPMTSAPFRHHSVDSPDQIRRMHTRSAATTGQHRYDDALQLILTKTIYCLKFVLVPVTFF
jgi:hypothetical protein